MRAYPDGKQADTFPIAFLHANRHRAMTSYNSPLLRLLHERGYIHQTTDAQGIDALAAKQIVPGYIGFDATAPSLHIGSLVQIMMLRRLQQSGHKPIVVMGGGTTKVGDP
jgi:tyrosyl-tRNA synthetase